MNTQFALFPLPEPEPIVNQPVVLVEKVHLTFEQWLERRIRLEFIAHTPFAIMQYRVEYLEQCWQDEYKWKEWCDGVQKTTKG